MTAKRKTLESGVGRDLMATGGGNSGSSGVMTTVVIDGEQRLRRQQWQKEGEGWVGRGCCVFVCEKKVLGSSCLAEGTRERSLLLS